MPPFHPQIESLLMHGRDWQPSIDVTGWLVTEKLDGVRAYWDGAQLWTRGANEIKAPAEFLGGLPKGIPLDGELWAGRRNLTAAVNAAKYGRFSPGITFQVFDSPTETGPWLERITSARARVAETSVLKFVGYEVLPAVTELEGFFSAVAAAGGEGLMLCSPRARGYLHGQRSYDLLKFKAAQAELLHNYLALVA